MGLRSYVNDLELFKNVNCSKWGRKFENGDFARSIESSIEGVKDDTSQKNNWSRKLMGYKSVLLFPILVLDTYDTIRKEKRKNSFYYKCFSESSELILNH